MSTNGKRQRRTFCEEFKRDAVNLVVIEGYTIAAAAKAVNVLDGSLREWHRKYAWIKEHRDDYSVVHLCRTMHVSKSGFYRWLGSEPSPRNIRTSSIRAAVLEVYQQSNGIYGSHRITEKPKSDERLETACRNTVAKAMKD